MPDTFNKIVFGGEWDATEIAKGIDGMTDALKRAQDAEAQLAKDNAFTTESAKDTAEGIKKLTAQIAALDKTNKDYAATNLQLTGRLTALKAQYDKYNATIEVQRKELDALHATTTKMTAAYDAAAKSVTNLQNTTGKSIAPSLNDGKITNAIGGVREKVKGVSADIAQTLSNDAVPAIDKATTGVESLGGSFGPMGVVAGVALGYVVKKLYELVTAETDAEITQKRLAAETKKVTEGVDDQRAKMIPLIEKVKEGNLTQEEQVSIYNQLKEINPAIVEGLDAQSLSYQKLSANAQVYIGVLESRLRLEAKTADLKSGLIKEDDLKKQLDDAQKYAKENPVVVQYNSSHGLDQIKSLEDQYNRQVKLNEGIKGEISGVLGKTLNSDQVNLLTGINGNLAKIDQLITKYKSFQSTLSNTNKDYKTFQTIIDSLEKERVKIAGEKDKGVGTKQVSNIYEQELQKLKADIAKVDEKGFTDETTITKSVEADFKKRDLVFQKAFKNKQLTAGQLASLQDNLKNLQKLVLDKSLKDFATQKAAYLQQIDDQLSSLQSDIDLKRISNLQDSFERERLTIIAESDKTTEALKQKRDKQIADLNKNASKNGITKAELQAQVDVVTGTYSEMLDTIDAIKNQKLQKLSFDTFEKLSEDAKRLLDSGNLGVSQGSLLKIQDLTAEYQAGKLSYQQYQKALTEIARFEANERFQLQKLFLEAEIKVRQDKLLSDKALTDDQVKRLQDEITKLQQQLADATQGNITTNTANGKSDNDTKIQQLLAYANAIKGVADGVISFWQQTNEAEQRALDRSIALQDRRVTAAQNVAAKGNAEYLRMEEEKDQQLVLKKENAARRQMAINAAIQASQLLVAITGAVAKIAEPGVGTVDVIASIGVIVGSLAAGYALVKSLQQNQPSFYVGTEDTGHGGEVDSKGGFNAVLHPHERVLTAEENKHLKGISNQKLIETVQKHRVMVESWKAKPTPQLNIAAMEMATTQPHKLDAIKMEGLERRMDENNVMQKRILQTLKGMGISFNWDERGASLSILKTLDEIDKSKKS